MKNLSKENSPAATRFHLRMVLTALVLGCLLGGSALFTLVAIAKMILK